jgi:hypothetical protein
MKSAVRTTALVIMPLATAVNMQALPITPTTLPTSTLDCYASGDGGSGSCSGGATQLSEYNNILGVKLYTDGPVTFSTMSGGTSLLELFISSGSLAGPGIAKDTVIPLSYSFELGLVPGLVDDGLLRAFASSGNINGWTLYYGLTSYGSNVGGVTVSGSGGGLISGTTNLTTTEALSGGGVGLEAQLSVTWTTIGWDDSLSINVPQSSIDFNAVPDESGVPEPGSMGLLASGLALLGWRVCRKRRA